MRFKHLLILLLMICGLGVPLVVAPAALAEPTNLECRYSEVEISEVGIESCDLAIIKQVKINNGEYVAAGSTAQAAQAKVGDTVTWKITVSNNSTHNENPFGIVKVHDSLPSLLTLTAANASSGEYDSSSGDWTFTLENNLPATLVITSTAKHSGTAQNTATLTDYQPDNCDGPCQDPPYVDANSANNTSSAFVHIAAPVTVVTSQAAPAPAAPKTGFGVNLAQPWQTLAAYGLGSIVLLALAHYVSKFARLSNGS